MSSFEIMAEVEQQQYQIGLSCTVLAEAEKYFESKKDFKYLPHYAEHILKLLYVATNILHSTEAELEKITDTLLEKYKEECHGEKD